MILLGEGALLKAAVLYSINHNYKIDYVFTTSPDVRNIFKIHDIPFVITSDYNKEYKIISEKCSDGIIFSINNSIILKHELLSIQGIKFFNIHSGILPKYKGRPEACIFFALLNNDTEYGVTLHIIDEGIDTGSIIDISTFEINVDDTFELIMTKSLTLCQKIFEKNISNIYNQTFFYKYSDPTISKTYYLKDIENVSKFKHYKNYKNAINLGVYRLWYKNLFKDNDFY